MVNEGFVKGAEYLVVLPNFCCLWVAKLEIRFDRLCQRWTPNRRNNFRALDVALGSDHGHETTNQSNGDPNTPDSDDRASALAICRVEIFIPSKKREQDDRS